MKPPQLTPEALAVWEQANKMWRQSYIMREIYKGFRAMEISKAQPTMDSPAVAAREFSKMMQKLTHGKPLPGGTRAASKLEVLFPNEADRRAFVELEEFIRHRAIKGAEGIGDSLARIGVALAPLSAAGAAVAGGFGAGGAVIGGVGFLEVLHLTSKLLAQPSGAKLLTQYFKSPTAAAATNLVRAAMVTTEPSFDPAGYIRERWQQRQGNPGPEASLRRDVQGGRRNMTDVMLAAKFGEIEPSAPRRIERALKRPSPLPR